MKQKFNFFFHFIITSLVILFFFSNSLFAYSFTWDEATGTLTINATNDQGEAITPCLCLGGDVTINGDWPKDGNGNYVHIAAANVRNLIINGGPGWDIIDLDCIHENSFPNLVKDGDNYKISVYGNGGPDDIRGSRLGDYINGGDGDDYVEGQEGDDDIVGGDGEDEIWGDEGADTISGGAGSDELDGGDGNDTIRGGDDGDEIYGGAGNDILYGDAGNDILMGDHSDENGIGADELYGGDGDDGIDLDFSDNVTDGGAGDDRYGSLIDFLGADLTATPLTLRITDLAGDRDELDFSSSSRGLKINLDLLNTPQELNSFGYNLELDGQFENLRGTPQDDEINICPLADRTRSVIGGLNVQGDVLNLDALGSVVIQSGVALDCSGYELIVIDGIEVVNILNTTDVDTEEEIPSQFVLNQNYPNPFNPATIISYALPEQSSVTLKVYDSLGNEIAELISEEQHAGHHEISFNAADLSSGVYYYKISAGSFSETKAMLLLK